MSHLNIDKELQTIRQQVVNCYALPIIKTAFNKFSKLNSAYLSFTNHIDDWGVDRIDDFILYSVLYTPDWKAFSESSNQDENYLQEDPINLPGFEECHYYITYDLWDEIEKDFDFDYYEATSKKIIAAFSPFCEYTYRNMSFAEAYTPYALFTRNNEEIKIEFVGKILSL